MSWLPARRMIAVAALLIAVMSTLAPGAVAASRASFTDEENQFMCIACHESLAVAQSQESFSERSFLRGLIAQGLTQAQIKQQMVANYGNQVLASPPSSGFSLTLYVLPPLLVAIGLITLVVTVPRWRRRARSSEAAPGGPALDPDDARRLEADLARHG